MTLKFGFHLKISIERFQAVHLVVHSKQGEWKLDTKDKTIQKNFFAFLFFLDFILFETFEFFLLFSFLFCVFVCCNFFWFYFRKWPEFGQSKRRRNVHGQIDVQSCNTKGWQRRFSVHWRDKVETKKFAKIFKILRFSTPSFCMIFAKFKILQIKILNFPTNSKKISWIVL